MPGKILSYNGGINTSVSLGTFPSNQLISGENVLISGASLINRNSPFNLLQNSIVILTRVSSIFYWIDTNGNEWFIFGALDNASHAQIYQMANDGSTVSPTVITSTGNVNEFAKYAVLNGILVIVGRILPLQWTGSGSTAALGASWTSLNVSMSDCRVVNNFLFMTGTGFGVNASTVYWSNVDDPTTYTSGNNLPFRQSDGDKIIGLSNIGQNLVIFKTHSTGILSTQTNFIAGAVTLGPLTTISETTGCLTSNSYDHLPDGRIILMGGDGHAYIFDGNIFTDISNQVFPNSNIQSLIDAQAKLGNVLSGAGFCSVRVYPIRHEAWFQILNSSTGVDTYIYDYLNNAWFQKPLTGSSHYLLTLGSGFSIRTGGFLSVIGTSSGVYQPYQAIFSGDQGGGLWLQDCGTSTDESGLTPTTQIEFSIPVPADNRENYQRFFVIPLKTGSSSQTITYYLGRDGTYGTGTTFTTTGGWDRLRISIPSTSNVTSYQVKLTYSTTASITFDPAYISDEVVQ